MLKLDKINVKLVNKDEELGNSRIEFTLSGTNIDYIIANTIRRTTMNDIPIYAFDEFKFDKNTSIFHNNYIKLRLRNMPVWGIENTVDFIDEKQSDILKKEVEQYSDNDDDNVEIEVDKDLNSSSLKQLTMYINSKNKTNDIINITTNDAKFYYEEKQILSPYKIAIPLVKLQPNQEISFSSITKIGIEERNAMFSAVCISVYKQNNDNDFTFIIESRGQISEKRIIEVALLNINKKLKNFIKMLNDIEYISNDDISGLIIVNKEDHTLGNLISRGLQQHENIDFAGYNMTHPLDKKVNIHYKLSNKKILIKKVLEEVVEYYSVLFNEINKLIKKNI